jgi:signal transduction histidine kinase
MKLINQFTAWYLTITLIVFALGSVLIFYSVQRQIFRSEGERLENLIDQVGRQLKKGTRPADIDMERVTIKEIGFDRKTTRFFVKDTIGWFSDEEGNEQQLKAYKSVKAKGHHYLISAYYFLPEGADINEGILKSLMWIFLLLLVLVFIFGRLISGRLLLPMKRTLKTIQDFKVNQKDRMNFQKTKTKEFQEMNHFLEKVTGKAFDDYRSLKEFTENASHELQTPLAVMRGKMDLLSDSGISEVQAKLMGALNREIERLSKINSSLLLLTKLENQQYDTTLQAVGPLILDVVERFRELAEMKDIGLETTIEGEVRVPLNTDLFQILLNNLFNNSIRHNIVKGKIGVVLKQTSLVIWNTGNPPDVATSQLLERFRKSNQSEDSIGLGLSIIKQICDLHHFGFSYEFERGIHTVKVGFTNELK